MDNNYEQNQDFSSEHYLSSEIGPGHKWKKILLIVVLLSILGLLVLAFYKGAGYVKDSNFCFRCHKMEPYYISWQQSGHSKISCYDCHFGMKKIPVKPAQVTDKRYWSINFGDKKINVSKYGNQIKQYVNKVNNAVTGVKYRFAETKALARFYPQLFNMMLGGRSDGAQITWGNCQLCHAETVSKTSKVDSTGHSSHLGIGLKCQDCHGDVVHEGMDKLTRDSCTKCHAEGPPKPKSHGTSDFKSGHGSLYIKRNSCRICHIKGTKEQVCMDCHGIEMPHGPNFLPRHIESISAIGIKKCLNCHESNQSSGQPTKANTVKTDRVTCAKCHGSKLFHKGFWNIMKTHGQQAIQRGTSGCYACHGSQKTCDKCHGGVSMPHPPNMDKVHTTLVWKVGGKNCTANCHQAEGLRAPTCGKCHGYQLPHPDGFAENHFRKKNEFCRSCHGSRDIGKIAGCGKCHKVVPGHWHDTYTCSDCHQDDVCNRCH